MKLFESLLILLFFGVLMRASAVIPTYDAVNHTTSIVNEIKNFATWAKTEADAAQTQLNTLQMYENTVLQVSRYGNPGALRNIPVIGSIA